MNMLRNTLLLGALGALAGCGPAAGHTRSFTTDWLDDQGKSIAELEARLRSAKPAAKTDLAVAVGGNGDKILGLPLAGGSPWTFAHALDVRPIIAGTVVVGAGKDEVFALDAATGKKLWSRPANGQTLLGAGDDGTTTAVSLGKNGGSTLLVVGHNGDVKSKIDTEKQIGAPAVMGGIVFVPWQNQYVSAIDPQSSDEVARVVIRDKISRALTVGGGLYFGEVGYVRFDERIRGASRSEASRIGIPARELPGTPRLLVPGDEKASPIANARDRDRLFARPSGPEGPLTIDSGHFYATYFRLAYGFESQKGQLSWVHTHPADLIGGEAVAGGLALCDETGKVLFLDARNGQVSQELSFGEPIKSCAVHADSYRAPASTAAAPSLGQQITTAVQNKEAELATGQRLLLRELGTIEDEGATKTLIEIASDPNAAPVLVTDARAAIASRRNGAQYMLAALAIHYDFLKDVLRSPPVGPIADALGAMKESKAAHPLALHLLDPADSDDDIRRAAAALSTLAHKEELPQLKQFFAMYRGTASSDEVATAVAHVGEALLRLEPKEGRALVEAAVKDSATVSLAKSRLEATLAAQPVGDKPAGDKPAGDKPAGDKPAGDKPAGDKPAGDKPAGDKPKPPGDKPAGDKPKPADKPKP